MQAKSINLHSDWELREYKWNTEHSQKAECYWDSTNNNL